MKDSSLVPNLTVGEVFVGTLFMVSPEHESL